jgi:hypothetical protein
LRARSVRTTTIAAISSRRGPLAVPHFQLLVCVTAKRTRWRSCVLPLSCGGELVEASRKLFDHRGLFSIRLDRPSAMAAAAKTVKSAGRPPGRGRVGPTDPPKSGLHRYCSGCAHETEHVAWTADGRRSTPSIRWPTAEPASGTTICLNCGQWRAASYQPRLPEWSSWPRSRIATRSVADAVGSADTADDCTAQTRAENEGMPPRREPPRTRRRARLRRIRAVGRT